MLKLLIIDDQEDVSSFGNIAKTALEAVHFEADHATSWGDAERQLERHDYDLFVIDVNLQGSEDGRQVLMQLRAQGYSQPIALVTANDDCLDEPIRAYVDVLSSGPVWFSNKNDPGFDIVALAQEMAFPVISVIVTMVLLKVACI